MKKILGSFFLMVFLGCNSIEKIDFEKNVVSDVSIINKKSYAKEEKEGDMEIVEIYEKNDEKIYNVEMVGEFDRKIIVEYLSDLLGCVVLWGDVIIEGRGYLNKNVFNREQLINEIKNYVNCYIEDAYVHVVGEGCEYYKVVNISKSVVEGILGEDYIESNGVYFICGEDAKQLKYKIKMVDGAGLSVNYKYTYESVEKIEICKKILDGVIDFEVEKVGNGVLLVFESGRDVIIYNNVMDDLDGVSGGYFRIPLFSVSVKDLLLEGLSEIKYLISERTNELLVENFVDYKKLEKYVSIIDEPKKSVYVKMYLIDFQKQKSKNYGADIKLLLENTEIITSLRDSVGVSVSYSGKDLDVLANYLVTNFGGRVVSSPEMVIIDGEAYNANFGQSIPILQSSQSSDSTLIQQVTYKSTGVGVGIKLDTYSDKISMDVSVTISEVLEQVGVQGNPLFNDNSLSGKVVCKSGECVLLGGLTRRSQVRSRRYGIPFLGGFSRAEEYREVYILLSASISETNINQDYENKIKNYLENY